ncbi:LLM class F420-dependent oxidoreductase [Amycolatopsis keratiniphila]|uniref:N5,N10-methylenetetrahydromethanopterin reductase-related protein n=1 Tax=Amycolatopsis keratiniphila TaxID=129921 RepID=R4SR14_9PSEU|nr:MULTISPECIES: LLM class F420-dependent oxidoreductase [Amycolatopsis]AGM05050.1 N5,N10-methylenetetrahydromethanopterin reductase-related protein [Amycolatopsis keratiniphila]RSN35356.1 LLM class F420-dependent oxidoreductase [Amycolatopsis sp. WAC 04169]
MEIGIATFITDEGIRPDVLAAAAEERGFSSLHIAEHSHIPVSRETPYPGGGELPRVYYRTLDPFVALTAAAGATSTLKLGTGVALLQQRDVIHTAKEVASLDLVSRGRFVFGVGVGWNREEMRNHGTDPRTRGALVDEQLAALKEIWTKDEAEFHGEHVDFDPIFAWPKPVQKPHPPIYIGGAGRKAMERIAKYGDGWLPHAYTPPEELRRARQWLADQGREDVKFSAFGATPEEDALGRLVEGGVDEATLFLPTEPEAATLDRLDQFAKVAESFRKGQQA